MAVHGACSVFPGLFLIYPLFETLWLSFHERQPGRVFEFVGFQNYGDMLRNRSSVKRCATIFFGSRGASLSTALGLVVAQLTDRLRWGELPNH